MKKILIYSLTMIFDMQNFLFDSFLFGIYHNHILLNNPYQYLYSIYSFYLSFYDYDFYLFQIQYYKILYL
jgi:hypothetical protein